MDQFIGVAERFGLPVVMLIGMSYALMHLFKWLANDLMRQLQNNADRIEKIVITLIDNSKKEREQNRESSQQERELNREHFNKIFQRLDTLVDVFIKSNGIKK